MVGLFGLPTLRSLRRHRNDTGTISHSPASALGRDEPRQPEKAPEEGRP